MLRALTTFLQKKIFLSLVLLATVVALFYPQNTFAAYENYKTLFTNTSGITLFSGTGQNSWAITNPDYKEGITGFRFNINLEFAPFGSDSNPVTDTQMGQKWDYISNINNGTNRVFIVRVCEVTTTATLNEDSCYIKEVPFTEYGVMDKDKKIVGVSQNVPGAGELTQKLILTPLQNPSFASGVYPYPGIFEKVWDPRGSPENPWMRGITIPFNTTGSDANWYWFKKGSSGNFERVTAPRFAFATKKLRADFWYCAGPAGTEDGTEAPEEGDIVKRFPGLCTGLLNNGTSYFRIGSPIDITLPTSLQEIGSQEVANNELSNTDTKISVGARNSNLPECSVTGGAFGGGTLMGCAAQIIFYLIFRPVAWFANIVGMLFDFFVGFSINDEAYRLEFIQNGWQVVRDFANIFFIIIMVYAGFSVALGFGKYSIKTVVGTLIVNALIINFSLFITRLGVDMSNIFARVFYNQMTVDTTETALGGYKPISVALISAFNPQKLMDANILTQSASQAPQSGEDDNGGDVNFNADGDALTQKSLAVNSSEYAAFFAIVSLSSALILFFVAKMFFSVAFIFIGRVVSLYVAMIFSPLAFLTKGDVPILGKISKINWNDWFSNYQKDLYLPPIFMFFLYIIGFLMSAGFATTLKLDAGTSYLEIFVSVAIPMVIVYLLISKAKGVAEKYSSEAAKAVTEKLEGAGKFVGGLAMGGAVGLGAGALAMGGRSLGGVASWTQKNTKLGNSITQNLDKKGFGGTMARLANKTLTGAQNNSFDLRDNKIFSAGLGKFNKEFGIKTTGNNAILGALNLNQENSKGGFAAMQKKREEELKKKAEGIATNFDDSDEGKAKAKQNYEEMQKNEFSKQEDGKKKARFENENSEIANRLNDKDNTLFKNEAEEELKAKKASGAITNYSIKDIEDLAKVNKGRWELANKTKVDEYNKLKESYDKFKKDQEGLYGKVKDNKTLTQALRLRYTQNVANDPAGLWDTARAATGAVLTASVIGAPLGVSLLADTKQSIEKRKAAAEKILKDGRKTFTAEQKKTQELDAAAKTINDELGEYITRTTAEMTAAGKPTAEIDAFKAKYSKAEKSRKKADGTEEKYYDHEALEEYEHFSKAYDEQIIEIEAQIAAHDNDMKKARTTAAAKAAAKEKARATAKRDKLKSATTKIEKERERKEKEKKDEGNKSK